MKRYLWVIVLLVFVLTPGLRADDTDIYGTTTVTITPNVLIIFDTSGSMSTKDIPGDYYDPDQTYTLSSNPFTKNAVYIKSWSWFGWGSGTNRGYTVFADDINDLNCASVKEALLTEGHVRDYIKNQSGNYECDGNKRSLYMGNYLNYDFSGGGTLKTRNEVAREVIKDLITNTDNVNFGLMRFNNDEGGRLIAPCGTDKATLLNLVDTMPASGYTPLAETLAEAGLYFAGKKSWFDGSDGTYSSECDDHGNGCYQYTSPMTLRCQKNYIIIMTDGEPTYDNNSKLSSGTYINGDTIGDYDNDGKEATDSMDYLDDVAKYLYDNDLNADLGEAGESFQKQNITTYTIGFTTQQELLSETAQNGGGLYYTANSISGLSDAFHEILADIADVSAVFVSPVVPVSRMNRTFAGSSLYVGFFKPQPDGRWDGNIKKYGLNDQGIIIDADGNPATQANGSINDNARSYWSSAADGADVLSGGIGAILLDQSSRNLYTYMAQSEYLTDSTNSFSTGNTNITKDTLGVADDTAKNNVINDIYGVGSSWKLGDILHSRPAVVHYDLDGNGTLEDSVIFTGGNDGMMHCFKDSDGSESWGFIPPDLLTRLQELSDSDTTHSYFVDGVPKVYEDSSQKILIFGERRGGNHYYALDVTDYRVPKLLYNIGPTFLDDKDGNENNTLDGQEIGGGSDPQTTLGQSWSEPTVQKIRTSSSTTEKVFLMTGGYDTNQDKPIYVYDAADPVPNMTLYRADSDTNGRSVFTINVSTGAISKLNVNAGYYSDMTHCIVDVSGFDTNGNGITNRVYAGDLGGNIFAFEDDGTGKWSYRKFFSAPIDYTTTTPTQPIRRKIFYAPDAVEETYGEVIFFGTGDRADPEGSKLPDGTSVINRIYAIRNHWENPATFQTLTESDIYDATQDLIVFVNAAQQTEAREALANKDGWYIKLNVNAGEKVTSHMTVFNGVVYFTTYTPESGTETVTNDCDVVSGRGQARLYALNYKTGEAAFEWSDIAEEDGDHNTVNKGRWDRSKVIGTSIASAPVVAILEGGPQIYTGVEGGVQREDPQVTRNMETFFWRQLTN